MRFDLIGASITHYASKWLPGLTKDVARTISESFSFCVADP
jgi:hypothetical protein